MKPSRLPVLSRLTCLCAAVLLLLTGCGEKLTPPTLKPDSETNEEIYQEALELAEAGWNYDPYLKFNSIREYKDSAQRADHHLREYMLWALEKGYYSEISLAVRNMNQYDADDRKFIISCADRMIAQGSEDSLFYAEYVLNMIGESDRTDELEELKKQAEYEAKIQEAISLYRAGRYDEAYSLLLYANQDNRCDCLTDGEYCLFDIYYDLSSFRMQAPYCEMSRESLFFLAGDMEMFSRLEAISHWCAENPEFADCRGDLAECLTHPAFYLPRFFGSDWKCGDYFINTAYDPTGESNTVIEHNLPKDYYPDIKYYFMDSENSCIYFCNNNNGEVFCLLGFSSDGPNPGEMYILDSESNRLTFIPYDDSMAQTTDAVSAADAVN